LTIANTIVKSDDPKHTLFNFLVGGAAGDGIFSAGNLFSRMMTRNSYYCHYYTEYPSLIRGGHNMVTIRVSDQPIYCQVGHIDILFAINQETIDLHINEVTTDGAIIFDPRILRRKKPEEYDRPDVNWIEIPLRDLAKSIGGAKVIQNTIGVAAAVALVDLPEEELAEILREMFASKPAIAEINVKASKLGYSYVKENYDSFKVILEDKDDHGLMMITGNTALVAGLIAGRISLFTGYPMSPATSVLETMVKYAQQFDYMTVQCEDEISAVTMAIGSNHAGGRAATATSGGGMALMVEAIGLAATAEIPLVVIDVMRPGPSTGLPTWTGQADLLFAIRLGQDSFPRIVITPGDVEECFSCASEALNLAEEYQLPVIILSDKWLGSSAFSSLPFDQSEVEIRIGKTLLLDQEPDIDNYKRYELSSDGVSTRALPGLPSNMIFRATGNEHDQYGSVDDDGPNRVEQMEKRMQKLETISQVLPKPKIYGVNPEEADVTIFSWGSNKGILLDVMKRLPEYKISLVQTTYMWPFPTEYIQQVFDKSKVTVLVEQNYDAQFGQLIRLHCLRDIPHKILRSDGRPHDPANVSSQIRLILDSQ
jgi:2-oxoglutarate ferredoxin oxidoreductase subunit alpha